MQALILAGGRGMQLRPLTDRVPKPMVPIVGKPFLEHQLELVRSAGIRDILDRLGTDGQQGSRVFR